ncbi:MAG TPA: protein kinase [Acidimicrobiales bacterium]|nr:protein kinase [Acidimicrobiales bacterium]
MALTPPPTGPSPAAGLVAGALLGGRYRLGEQLASGGMAQVWLGTDEVLRRAIAVKILHQHLADDETFVARFRHEAIAVARLSHPAIVSVYDTCSDNGVEAIVMELVRGRTLRQRLDEGPVDPWLAANIAAQVCGALAVAHAAGLVHRDIKPANILLSEDGRVKVGDFGIAKAAESADLTQEGSFLGTAKYLAPEQVEAGPVDGRTDLYGLGVVLYEMLCGRVPFEGDSSSSTALARLHRDPQRPRLVKPGIPRELEAITMRLVARSPDNRYPTASEARAALLGAGADDGPTTGDATVVEPGPAGVGTRSVATAGADGHLPPPPAAPPTPLGTPAVQGPGAPVRFAETERRWLVPTLLVVLVAVALGVAGLLIQGSGTNLFGDPDDESDSTEAPPAAGASVPIAQTVDFDPAGGDGEHASEAAAGDAFDGDQNTSWSTEDYNTPDWGRLGKPGVGLILELDQSTELRALEFDTPSVGWQAEVYVAESDPGNLEGWGQPVATFEGSDSGTNSVTFDETGGAVLLWFTRAGDDGQVTVTEVRLQR